MIHGDKTNYDRIAETYLDASDRYILKYYERPYVVGKLPSLSGKTVLDLGCGTGYYSQHAVEHGARTISVDASRKIVQHTSKRCHGKNEAHVHDLAKPFTFLEDASVDVIVCSLVLHYIERWEPVLAELFRVLKPGGVCVVSTHHPTNDFTHFGATGYSETRLVEDTWKGFKKPIVVSYFTRPLREYLRPLLESDFHIRLVDEPKPLPELEYLHKEIFDRLTDRPTFLFFVLDKEASE